MPTGTKNYIAIHIPETTMKHRFSIYAGRKIPYHILSITLQPSRKKLEDYNQVKSISLSYALR